MLRNWQPFRAASKAYKELLWLPCLPLAWERRYFLSGNGQGAADSSWINLGLLSPVALLFLPPRLLGGEKQESEATFIEESVISEWSRARLMLHGECSESILSQWVQSQRENGTGKRLTHCAHLKPHSMMCWNMLLGKKIALLCLLDGRKGETLKTSVFPLPGLFYRE